MGVYSFLLLGPVPPFPKGRVCPSLRMPNPAKRGVRRRFRTDPRARGCGLRLGDTFCSERTPRQFLSCIFTRKTRRIGSSLGERVYVKLRERGRELPAWVGSVFLNGDSVRVSLTPLKGPHVWHLLCVRSSLSRSASRPGRASSSLEAGTGTRPLLHDFTAIGVWEMDFKK